MRVTVKLPEYVHVRCCESVMRCDKLVNDGVPVHETCCVNVADLLPMELLLVSVIVFVWVSESLGEKDTCCEKVLVNRPVADV